MPFSCYLAALPFSFGTECAIQFPPSGSCVLIGFICWSWSLGLFMHRQFNVAPLSSIGSLGVRQRSWGNLLVLIVLIVSPILSCPQCLILLYWLPPLLSARVASSWWPPFLDQHSILLWFMPTQYPWVQQCPSASRMCFPSTHLGGLFVRVSVTFVVMRVLILTVDCCSCWVKLAMVTVRSVMVLLWVIILSLSAAAGVTKFMRASWVSSPVSLRLFAPWYRRPGGHFFSLLYLCCAAWKCAWKFSQVLSAHSLLSHLSQLS